MAKRKKKQEETNSYEPFKGYSEIYKPQTMTNEEYLKWRQSELPYTKRQGRSLIKGRNVLNDYMKKQKEKYDAGRKVIESTITMPIAQKKFQRREMGADPLGKKWDLAKDGKTQLTMPALTEDEKKTVNRYNASKGTGNQVWDKNGQPLDKVSVSKGKAAEAYLQDIAQRKAQQQAQKAAEGNSYPTFRKWRKANNQIQTGNKAITIGDYNSYINGLLKDRDTGIYDQGTDPYMMSDAGIAQNITRNDTKAKEAAGKAEELVTAYNKPWNPEQNWAGIFDMVEDWDEAEDDAIMRGKYTNEEKLEAQKRYSAKRNSRDSLKQEVTDKAEAYFESFARDQWINDWENASDDEKEQLRGIMYDKIMPDQYADRVARMTPEQKEQFNAEFDKMLDTAIGEGSRDWFDYEDDYNTYMAQKNANEKQAAKLREEQKRRKSIETLTGWAKDSTQSADFNPGLVQVKQFSPDEWHDDYYYEPEGTETDKAYFYANNVPADLATIDPNNMNKYYFIASDPEILNTFTKLYNQDHGTPGKVSNMADQFLQALDPYLNYCLSHYQDNWIREIAEDPVKGPIMRAAAIPLNAVGSMVGLAGVPMAAMGLDSAQDPNSGWYITSKMVTTTRQHQNEKAGEALGDLVSGWFDEEYRDQVRQAVKDGTVFGLNVVDSITDNFFAKGIGTLIAGTDKTEEAYKKTKNVIQWIMSGEAASNTMIQKLQENKDPTEAAIYAIADGVIEWVTEEKSIESWLGHDYRAMLGDKAALRRTIRNAMIAEGSEEINADALNLGVDIIMSVIYGHENELTERYNNLIANDVKPDEAFRRVLMDKLGQMGVSGLAGAASGGLMAGGMYMGTAISNRQTGSNINSNENTYEGETGTNRTVELGLQMDNDTMAHDIAMRLQQQIDNGEKPSDYDIGKLAQAIQIEASETLRKADSGENVSEEELNKSLDTLKSMAEIREGRKAPADLSGVGLQYAAEEDIRQAEGERITDGNEVIHDGRFTRLLGVESDGKNGMRFRIQTENGTQTVDSDAILATDAATASIIRQATVYQKGLYSAEYVNKLLGNKNSADTMELLQDATRLRLNAYLGQAMPETKIDRKLAIELYNMSVQEHAANRKAQVGQSNRQTQGRVTYKGFEYGTTEWNNALKEIKNKNIRAEMDAIAGIAQRAGIEVTFMDLADTEQALQGMGETGDASKYYGWENRSGISVNMEGLNYGTLDGKADGRHNMVVTFGHEMTHWLQRNSLQGYNRLEQFVMNDLIKNEGMSRLVSRLDMYMRGGETLEGAISEVVANSCDQILGNEQVMEHIQNTDKSLYQEVKNFVRDLVSRVKNAIRGMSESASYEGRAMIRSANEMAKVWLGAYDEALTQAAEENANGEEKRFSRAYEQKNTEGVDGNPDAIDTGKTGNQNPSVIDIIADTVEEVNNDAAYQAAVERGDLETATRMLMEKLKSVDGVIPFMAPEWHAGESQKIAENLKDNEPEAIRKAAEAMAKLVPDNAVLIPMPGRNGIVEEGSWIMNLTNRIAELSGRPVVVALEGQQRESRQEAKHDNRKGVSQEELGFRVVEEIPEGTLPIFIDNTVGTGITADAARIAMGGGITLAYTKTLRSPGIVGLKNVLVTYESKKNGGALIPLSQRFDVSKRDVRYSKALTEEQQADVQTAEENGIDLDPVNHTASRYSRASWMRSEFYKDPKGMARELAKNVLGSTSRENVAKATKWIQDVTSISALIGENSDLLDYVASPGRSSFKSNPEYGGSIDSSTICAKRRLQTGTIDAIQRALPEYVMSAEDFLQVRRMMKERGYEVSCGLCFVESSRKNIAKYASQFMREWNSQHPDNQVNMTQINTVLGLEDTRLNNKEVYEAYEKFMNKLAQRKPKLFEMRSEYNNDILKHFRNDASVEQKNKNGGMRINSFSDFEIVHLIDMMQVIMDMSNVGLAGQAYTKVREFAEALGPTGLKINMSMIAAGVDENGRIIFDEVEGMKWADVEDLRNKYADNVGTVCVVFTEDQLMAAMADDRIDFIIPFHRSQWNKSNYKDIGLPENVKDFTYWQNERYAKSVYGTKKDGTPKKLRATNYMPNEYWNPELSGKENAEAYLRMCYENNKIPKFWKWLQSNGDGSFSLKEDGSTDGYWKLLGDFKMYNHLTGEYAPQLAVQPNFDMDACRRMLAEYKGGHETFPEATDVVNDFVNEKKKGKKGISRGKNGQISLAGSEIGDTHFSRWTEEGLDVNTWMMNATPSTFQTEDEQALWQAYKDLRIKMSLSLHRQNEYQAKIRQLESKANLTAEERDELTANRNRLEIQQKKMADLEDELYQVTSSEGYAGMMYRQNMVLKDYIQGKTQDQVRQTVEGMLKEVQQAQEEIKKDRADLMKLAETQAVKTVESYMSKSSLGKMAGMLRSNYNSAMGKGEIQSRLAEMALKQAQGEDITSDAEQLAQDLLDKMRGIQTDALQQLKGTTLRISEELAKEMRAENLTMADLRRQLKGSGVTIKTEKGANFRQQWAELYDQNQSLPNIDEDLSESGALHHILDFIQGEVEASRGINQNGVNFDEVAAVVKIAAGNITTYLVDDPAARRQIENLMGQVKELAGKTGDIAQKMEELDRRMDEVVLAGQKAKGWTTILQRDVNEAIKYYNKTARVAAQVEKTKVRKALIEQLRSENTKKLLAQQDAFKERLKNDKKARELAHDNGILRNKISTVATRMANRIFAETDQKNVPEEAKAMVRQVLYMISQHDGFFRKVTYWDKQQVDSVQMRLAKMISYYGPFNPDTDLDWLVVKAPNEADNDYSVQEKVIQDLVDLETGLMEYRNAEGRGRITLQDRKDALTKVQEALSEIWNVVQARSEMEIAGRKWQVIEMAEWMRDEMKKSRFKGERKGFGSRTRNALTGGVTWGNLTPEYFFKNLKNGAMSELHKGLKDAENRSGLEAAKAKERLAEIAEKNGFASWDGQEEHQVKTRSGEITMTTEQIMALYATWLRESNALRPEETAHLLHGGFVLAEKENNKGLPGREKKNVRPIRMSKEHLAALGNYLTEEQKQYVNDMVAYMSGELAELGNEASMKMYGIKKFTEKYYFPIKSWGGVLNKRSDAGISSSNENRAAQQGFSKRIKNNASNAIEIGDFTPTAVKHVAGMITYNTVGPAIENLNKVLNQQLTYGEIKYTEEGEEDQDDTYKVNMRAAFENEYGKQASDYLAKFMKDMNGGVTTERTAFDKLLSLFKKNAVAGSLSVAAQQPLSYIRAAMMINPKYLAAAISPQYWKGSYKEMMQHSGVAVIKAMGKFDMNFGQTMQEWITPEGMQSKARKAWNWTTDKITGLPGAMDAMTWTRMWTAVKLEQAALNPGMDTKSDEFLQKVAERFNDLMRQTQVYDSVMTKSQNMRSQRWYAKTLTSFMAEPTLSLNVLADAFQNVKEKGGKMKAVKAVVTFLLSAAAQAGAKAFFGAGRTPDKKKNREENFLNKFGYNLLSEANPLGLIPGYRQIIETLTDGEFQDDTMGMIAKAGEVVENIYKLATDWNWSYRDLEDSVGQFLQMTTDIPAKNMMRDFRAMVNFFSNGEAEGFTGNGYAKRQTSNAVLNRQAWDTFMSSDLIGLINKKLGDAGYGTSNTDYYTRIYNAERSGNQAAADEMKEYLLQGKGVSEDSLTKGIRSAIKEDQGATDSEKITALREEGMNDSDIADWAADRYKKGELTREEATKLIKESNPKMTDNDVWWKLDRVDYNKETGQSAGSGQYYRFRDAIENGKQDDMTQAVKLMTEHGMELKNIMSWIGNKSTGFKTAYLNAKGSEKDKLRLKLIKAYKAVGLTESEAIKLINSWKETK